MSKAEIIKKWSTEFLEILIRHAVNGAKELEQFDSVGFYSNHVRRLESVGEDLLREAGNLGYEVDSND